MTGSPVPYPPPPWKMTGRLWMTLAATVEDMKLPAGLKPILRRHVVISVASYLSGTLCYNELAVGALVRSGKRVGVFVPHIWVDDLASLWGGRRLWGVPKQLATFIWDEGKLSVSTEGAEIVGLSFGVPRLRLPPVLVPAGGFGTLDAQRIYLPSTLRASFSLTRIRLTCWSPSLPPLAGSRSFPSLMADPCRFTFHAGRILHTKEAGASR